MDAPTTRSTARAIDRSIRKVGEAEYRRLTKGVGTDLPQYRIRAALNSLGNLRYGKQPDYQDEWVALFYALWYQPKQINLVYGLIQKLLSVRRTKVLVSSPNRRLNVIDLGCGALATQFAVALAATDAVIEGQPIEAVRIHSFDTSQPMINLGAKLWERFRIESTKIPSLNHALSLIEPQYGTSPPQVPPNELRIGEYWVSAIHAVYDDNTNAIRRALLDATAESPSAVLLATHSQKASLLQDVRPARFKNYSHGIDGIEVAMAGTALQVSKWRQWLNAKLSYLHPFLDADVYWRWQTAAWSIYSRPR